MSETRNKTATEIIDELTQEQKDRVYYIIGDILNDPSITIFDVRALDLRFLHHDYQRIAVRSIIMESYMSHRKRKDE